MNDLAQAYLPNDEPRSLLIDPLAKEPKASALATRMGRLLLQSGKIDSSQLNAIMQLQTTEGLRFGEAALKLGLVSPADIGAVLAEQFAYPRIDPGHSKLAPCLTAAFQPDSRASEALRSLRSELLLRYFNQGEHLSLALVGTEGAARIARTGANLAISFAQLGLRTLLVDANLREPQLHRWLGVDARQAGLSDLLAGRSRAQPLAVEELQHLWLLPAGTPAPNPQELLASRQYRERMTPLFKAYDLILLNTAPLGSTLDAQLVAAQAGAALVVTKTHSTRLKPLSQHCANLTSLGVRLLGAALHE
ncbi:chain-length determining protein [Cellvibrio japonicus]|uniref:EpsG n=1 Tax=Cellvibrio japonicus (strain Ueda107) TaxID=498211 RepID=B3PJL6_CELJU|nr:chain-length determining protein [Cellvibrio japonicus]ACE84245.1 EpsG [Cellvibrio japonicus Ueda107]QEI11300.1 chain-length determining protein [Cellvibrio japonicus]QEI14874.1 chain-length determining protein [Cellvibrio japonicus]QEI18454.1 chain-length determining protein [Cellvibrio japonicus]